MASFKTPKCPSCKDSVGVFVLEFPDLFRCAPCNNNWRVIVPAKTAADGKTGMALALLASDAMAHLVSAVRTRDEEKTVVYAEQITHALAKLLARHGIELGEVLPLTTCSRCKRPCIEYRRYGDERVCVLCITEHVMTSANGSALMGSLDSGVRALGTELTRLRSLEERHRLAIGLLTDLAAPSTAAQAFLDREAKL